MDNLEIMDTFLETYNPARLNHEEIEPLNRPITRKEIKSVIKSSKDLITPRPDGFPVEFYQIFKE